MTTLVTVEAPIRAECAEPVRTLPIEILERPPSMRHFGTMDA